MTIVRTFLGALAAVAVFASGALAATAFTDVADNHPASAEITAAHQIGVFNGYGDGTFRPDGKLTQAQAENVIWRMLSWHATDDDGNFEITRADAAVLAMTGLCGLDPDRIPACDAITGTPETDGAGGTETGTLVGLCVEIEAERNACVDVAPVRVQPGTLVQVRIPAGEDQCRVHQRREGSNGYVSFGGGGWGTWLYSGGDLYEFVGGDGEAGLVHLEYRLRIWCRASTTEYVARVVVDYDTAPPTTEPPATPVACVDDRIFESLAYNYKAGKTYKVCVDAGFQFHMPGNGHYYVEREIDGEVTKIHDVTWTFRLDIVGFVASSDGDPPEVVTVYFHDGDGWTKSQVIFYKYPPGLDHTDTADEPPNATSSCQDYCYRE